MRMCGFITDEEEKSVGGANLGSLAKWPLKRVCVCVCVCVCVTVCVREHTG